MPEKTCIVAFGSIVEMFLSAVEVQLVYTVAPLLSYSLVRCFYIAYCLVHHATKLRIPSVCLFATQHVQYCCCPYSVTQYHHSTKGACQQAKFTPSLQPLL